MEKMKDTRTEKIINELKELTIRLNKIDLILQKMDVTYSLHRQSRTEPWKLSEIVQKVEY